MHCKTIQNSEDPLTSLHKPEISQKFPDLLGFPSDLDAFPYMVIS